MMMLNLVSNDAKARIKCISMSIDKLRDVHEPLCHSVETKMTHFVGE